MKKCTLTIILAAAAIIAGAALNIIEWIGYFI